VRASREACIAIAVAAVAVAAMAIDHLIGTESEPGESEGAEPFVFVGTSVVALALTAALFRFAVMPARRDPNTAGKRSILYGVLAVVALPLLFLAIPFPFAGAAVALGLVGRDGRRRAPAIAAVVIGVLVVALGVGAYLYELL
jgi:cytochrome bd-type quinol oxidase subunit 2